MVLSCLGRLAMFAQPSWYIVALPCVSETNKKKREGDKIIDVPVEREVRCCFARGRGGKSWRKLVSACALALAQILYKVPLKVTKGECR